MAMAMARLRSPAPRESRCAPRSEDEHLRGPGCKSQTEVCDSLRRWQMLWMGLAAAIPTPEASVMQADPMGWTNMTHGSRLVHQKPGIATLFCACDTRDR
jgi:hypothetical protein